MPSSADSIPLVPLAVRQGWKVAGCFWEPCTPFLPLLPHPTAFANASLHHRITLTCSQAVQCGQGMSLPKEEDPMQLAHRTFGIPFKPGAALQWDQSYRAHSQTKDPTALAPGSARALQHGRAMPPHGTASPAPSAPVPSTGPTWSTVPAGHGARLLPRLCHQDFSIHPTPRSGTRRRHEVLPHLGIGFHTMTDRR